MFRHYYLAIFRELTAVFIAVCFKDMLASAPWR